MQTQFARQFKTFSDGVPGRVSEEINKVLLSVPCRVVNVFSIAVQKIGGTEQEAIVVFERTDIGA